MLRQGVDGVGPGGVGGRGQDVQFRGDADDVRGVAAAGPLGVVGMDRPAGDGGDGILDKPGLVQRVGMNGYRNVETVGYI